MIAPPRFVERLLESLGSHAEYRDAVLGDMSQEFSERAECDGRAAARWWYYEQAVRAVPALVRDSVQHAGARGIAYVLAADFAAFAVVGTINAAIMIAVVMAMGVHPDSMGVVYLAWRDLYEYPDIPMLPVIGPLVHTVLLALSTGYVAAWIGKRAPLMCALGLGAIQVCQFGWFVARNGGLRDSMWSTGLALNSLFVLSVGVVGALLRVLHTSRRRQDATVSS